MILKNDDSSDDIFDLEAHLIDGRLTADFDKNRKTYRIREIDKKVKELGRPLTSEELTLYESDNP